MNKNVMTCVAMWLTAAACHAFINPNFTPVELVGEANLIVAAKLKATGSSLEWAFVAEKTIKGTAPGQVVLTLAQCNKDHVEDITRTFGACAEEGGPVALFTNAAAREKRAFLHINGQWLEVRLATGARWEVVGPVAQMSSTYEGGTDTLVRMAEHLAREPDAFVPVKADVRWYTYAKVGQIDGQVPGMEMVEIGESRRSHLYVASSAGDRLFRPKEEEEGFTDVTARAGLDARSRAFLWLDVSRDGLADLVTWDGSSVSVRLATQQGAFKDAGAAWTCQFQTACTGFAACRARRIPGVLASTDGRPILLAAEPGGWKAIPLADSAAVREDLGRRSRCIVADLDSDGFAEVLLPAERGGLLWEGTTAGFESPVRINVSTGEGGALAALGDFDGNGALDVFFAGATRNRLWENDGRGRFLEVSRYSGSPSVKCPAGPLTVRVMDLNHDGWPDLALGYASSDLLYHFNRGFRTFGEEREVRLPQTPTGAGQGRLGQRALAAADFNADGSHDLAVLFANGALCCYYNDRTDSPGLHLRLPKGVTGPVTASCWVHPKNPLCTGTVSVTGHSPGSYVAVHSPGEVTIRYRFPGKPEQTQTVIVADGPKEIILSEGRAQ